MGFDRHLFCRGAVWQWRRRVCGFSTGTFVLQLSLRTTDRRLAIKLGREMSVECDRMLDRVDPDALCKGNVTSWAKQVFAAKVRELDLSRQIARSSASGPSAADNQLWDDAALQAWNCIEAYGISAEWKANSSPDVDPISQAQSEAGQQILRLLKENLRSPAKAAEFRSSFEAMTGQSVFSATQIVQLMQAYISATAHAYRSFAALGEGRNAGIREALDVTLSEMISSDDQELTLHDKATTSITAAISADITKPSCFQQDGSPCVVANPTSSYFSAEGGKAGSSQLEASDPALTAVVGRLMEEKASDSLRTATIVQYGSCIELFSKITGITDVRDVTQATVSSFRDGLRRISNSYGKSKADKILTYAQLLQKAVGLPQDRVGLSPTTVNRHLDHIRQVIEKADSEGIALTHKVDTSKLRLKERKRDRDKRAVFRANELQTVFGHTLWTGNKGRARRHEAGAVMTKDGQYWCPLVASVTGARLEEIAALTVSDIGNDGGISYFIFDENEIRDVKTEASRRRVPIHSGLIGEGFLAYVEDIKNGQHSALFPDLAPGSGSTSKYGKRLGYNWRKSLELTLDGNPRELCFHSIRHFVNKTIRDMNDVPRLVRLHIVGQEATDTNDRVYAEETELPVMLEVIERLPILWQSTDKNDPIHSHDSPTRASNAGGGAVELD